MMCVIQYCMLSILCSVWDLVNGAKEDEDVVPERGQSVCAFTKLTMQ